MTGEMTAEAAEAEVYEEGGEAEWEEAEGQGEEAAQAEEDGAMEEQEEQEETGTTTKVRLDTSEAALDYERWHFHQLSLANFYLFSIYRYLIYFFLLNLSLTILMLLTIYENT